MAYEGSCHCGAVTFRVEGDRPTEAVSCNCSHCRRKGLLLTFVPDAQFTLTSGQDALVNYQFHKHVITHQFCRTCGTQPFAQGDSADGTMHAINLRCVPSIDIDGLTLKRVNGASF